HPRFARHPPIWSGTDPLHTGGPGRAGRRIAPGRSPIARHARRGGGVLPMNLVIENVGFTYPGGAEALRDVSLGITPGEAVAIIGENGAGKTTLVKHFNGLLKPNHGRVTVGDWDTREHTVAKLAARVG